nr:hypothetical protein [Sedimentitalea nanhaiensis]
MISVMYSRLRGAGRPATFIHDESAWYHPVHRAGKFWEHVARILRRKAFVAVRKRLTRGTACHQIDTVPLAEVEIDD